MSHDRSTVEAVVKGYFDALYEGDADKMGTIFHPSADLRWVEKGELKVLTVPDCLGLTTKPGPPRAAGKPAQDFLAPTGPSADHPPFTHAPVQPPPPHF